MVGHREEAALGVLAACFVSLAAQARRPSRRGPGGRASEAGSRRIPSQHRARLCPLPDKSRRSSGAEVLHPRRHAVRRAGGRLLEAAGRRRAADGQDRRRARRGRDHRRNRRRTGRASTGRATKTRRRSICSSTTWAASAICGRRTISASPASDDQPANPAKQFATILREGPPLGIHTARLVRHLQQRHADVGSAEHAGFRDAESCSR